LPILSNVSIFKAELPIILGTSSYSAGTHLIPLELILHPYSAGTHLTSCRKLNEIAQESTLTLQ